MKPQQQTHVRPGLPSRPTARQVVDPFVVARPAPAAAGPASTAAPKPAAYRPPAGPLHVRYMSDVRAPKAAKPVAASPMAAPRPRPSATGTPPPTAARPARPAAAATPAARPWSFEEKETWRDRPGKNALMVLGGLLLGALSLYSLELGELALAVYAIVAVWRRWPSRQAFSITLGVFGGIVITSLREAWRPLADNLAVYAFLLLCVGTVLMWLEMRRDARARPQTAK